MPSLCAMLKNEGPDVQDEPNRGKAVFLLLFLVTLGSMLASAMVLVHR